MQQQSTLIVGRPIDRLQPPDRDRIRADVTAFIAYARSVGRRGLVTSRNADHWRELAAADLEDEEDTDA
jgi:hypothetical protein